MEKFNFSTQLDVRVIFPIRLDSRAEKIVIGAQDKMLSGIVFQGDQPAVEPSAKAPHLDIESFDRLAKEPTGGDGKAETKGNGEG